MWQSSVQATADEVKLNEPTEMFDNCGVYDDGTAIAKPSQYPKWTEALSFLEWYGVPLMDHFGVIIIDDENTDQYAKVTNLGYSTSCYKSARRLAAASQALLVSMAAVYFTMI